MKKVVVIPNRQKDKELIYTKKVIDILSGYDCNTEVFFDSMDSASVPPEADLYIVLGGDGSIMRAGHAAARNDIPILGVNIGTMGFMAELESTELDQLARLAVRQVK